MALAERIEAIIAPTVEDLGFSIVRVLVFGGRKAKLQIMAERKGGGAIDVEDCATISQAVSALLDVEDPIASAYTLEVSSPGVDRPLVKLDDFERYAGFDAKVETARPFDGRRRFKGRLKGVDGQTVLIETDDVDVAIDFADIQKAKLLMTDELMAASRERLNK